MQEKVKGLIQMIDQINTAENAEYVDRDLEELGPAEPLGRQKLEQKIQELNQRLKSQPDQPPAAKEEAA